MKKKEEVYNSLVEIYKGQGVDAQALSEVLNMTRANVSHELNLLWKEGKVQKLSGRPVLYFPSKGAINLDMPKENELDDLVKSNISLRQACEQAKAAILYPPKGMHCLILGDTGVGKSMFAHLIYNYAVDMGVKKKDSPFISFNCADYSNNPQLLTAHLFGVKKGAYTGADKDRQGLIEKADGGILFLDEVHRLPPEGQEILFTFLDKGCFRRIGDVESITSDVLIISATTEEPSSALLKTFTRRIPMVIKIPSLKERTLEERFYLTKSFFKYESIRLNRCIFVSLNTMRAFLSYDCPNNIGQLKSDVQLVCAKAYSEFLTNKKEDVRICSRDLPAYIKEGLYIDKQHRILWNKVIGDEVEFFKFSDSSDVDSIFADINEDSIYEIIDEKLRRLKNKGISDIDIENILEKDIARYFHKQIDGVTDEINKRNLINIIGEDILELTDKVVCYAAKTLNRNLCQNSYTALALHINTLVERVNNKKRIMNPQLAKIKEMYPREFKVALAAKGIIEEYIHSKIPEDEAGFITIFLLEEEEQLSKTNNMVKVILIAHGETTATSMADVANKLLGEDYAIGIDASLDVSPMKILNILKELVRKNLDAAGFLLLVDMGSLTTFGETIEREFNIPVKVVPLVSTLHVIEAARKALLGFPLDSIYNSVMSVNSYIEANKNINENGNSNKRMAIITACLTGEGASVALKSFLKSHLKYDKEIFEFIPINCLDKQYLRQRIQDIQNDMEILFIVSSVPLATDIRQYNVSEVINLKVIKELQEIIDVKTTMLRMGFVLKENIDNLDGEQVFEDIQYALSRIGSKLSLKLDEDLLLGVILHFAFMLSRVKKGDGSIEFPDKIQFIEENKVLYESVKQPLLFLSNKYRVSIPEDEICYIMRFFQGDEEYYSAL